MFYSVDLHKRDLGIDADANFAYHYEGAFKYGNEIYNVKTAAKYELIRHPDDKVVPPVSKRHLDHQNAELVIYRVSDLKRESPDEGHDHSKHGWCGADNLEWNSGGAAHDYLADKKRKLGLGDNMFIMDPIGELLSRGSKQLILNKRDGLQSGCPTTPKIVYVGAVADCSYIATNQFTADQAKTEIIAEFNIVSAVYKETFGIFLGLINVLTYPDCGTYPFN